MHLIPTNSHMKLLDRYILKEVLSCFMISLLSFTAILLTVRLIQLTSLIVNKGLVFSQIATIFIAIIPTFLEIAIPMSALLGVMLAFARLSGDSEIIVMRASGISLISLSKSIFFFGFIVSIVGLFISIYLSPWGNRKLSTVLYEIARSKSTAGLDEAMFNKLGKLTVYAENINHTTGNLKHVIIQDDRSEQKKFVISSSGQIISDDANQRIVIKLQNGDIHEQDKKNYDITHFDTNRIVLSADQIYDPDAKIQGRESKKMSLEELEKQKEEYLKSFALFKKTADVQDFKIEEETMIPLLPEVEVIDEEIPLKELTKRIARLDLESGKRFSMPLACLILALVAMPLGIQPPRAQKAWGAGLSSIIGLLVFITYFGILSIGMAIAEKGSMNPYVALWMPNIIMGAFTAILLEKMNSEKWQSTAHFIESVGTFFKKIKKEK